MVRDGWEYWWERYWVFKLSIHLEIEANTTSKFSSILQFVLCGKERLLNKRGFPVLALIKGTNSESSDRFNNVQFSSSVTAQLFATPWTAALQASLSFTISPSLLKLMSTELVMPSNIFILCRPILILPSIFPSIRIFTSESALHIRWPKY